MRRCSALIGLAGLLVAAMSAHAWSEDWEGLPNFVVIVADDMGYSDAACYDGWLHTPNIDRLANEGLRFTDFHSSGAVCSPTRAGLMTGRYQQRAGVPGVVNADPNLPSHRHGLDPAEITYAELLKEKGYATALFGKWHLGYDKKFNPMHHGFDQFRGYVSGNIDYHAHLDRMGTYDWWNGLEHVVEEGYSTHLITRHARRFIEENSDRPFCLTIAHEAVHDPFQAPEDPPVRGAKTGKVDRPRQETYRRMMEEMDTGIGEIIHTLEEQGIAERTLVFFFSDNGPANAFSAGPLRGKKGMIYEGGHRVPAIAWWPGTISSGTTDSLAISLDCMPTILDYAGVSLPDSHFLDGRSLREVLQGGDWSEPRVLFWKVGNSLAMREGPWKAVIDPKETPQLYHLGNDLGEQNDLALENSKRMKEMMAAIKAWEVSIAPDSDDRSLKDVVGSRFPIGVGVGHDALMEPENAALILKHFSILTPENCMKPQSVHPAENEWNFDQADRFADFARSNKLEIVGHCLVWAKDDRTDEWMMQEDGGPVSRETLLQRIEAHVSRVVERYADVASMWDVVNEAIGDGDGDLLRDSVYSRTTGMDFIVTAFNVARANDPEALLVYNDYNCHMPGKREKLIQLLTELKNRGAPVDAYGMQGHFELGDDSISQLRETFAELRKLGIKVVVSELDIDVVTRSRWWAEGGKYREELASYDPYKDDLPEEIEQKQIQQYVELFKLFHENRDIIARVSFWNLHDGQSWLNDFPWKRVNYPLLFDRNRRPKPAFDAVYEFLQMMH